MFSLRNKKNSLNYPQYLLLSGPLNVFTVYVKSAKGPCQQLKVGLIRLGRCGGWSESSLGACHFVGFCHVTAHMLYRNREN